MDFEILSVDPWLGGEWYQTHWRKTNHFLSFFSSCFFLFFDWLTGWIFGFYPLIPDWGFEISSSSLYPRHWLTDWLGGQGFRLAYLRSLQACIMFLLLFHNLNRKLLFLTSFLEFANIKTPLLSFDYERGFDLVKIAVSKFRHKSARFEQIVQFPKILFCIINCISSNVKSTFDKKSPNSYPCQWVSAWVIDSFSCELVFYVVKIFKCTVVWIVLCYATLHIRMKIGNMHINVNLHLVYKCSNFVHFQDS